MPPVIHNVNWIKYSLSKSRSGGLVELFCSESGVKARHFRFLWISREHSLEVMSSKCKHSGIWNAFHGLENSESAA